LRIQASSVVGDNSVSKRHYVEASRFALSIGPVKRLDFVVAFQPENIVALHDCVANALRKAFAFLRWILDEL
jgi:hypothetical protein